MIFVIVHLEEVCNYVYLCSLLYVLQVSSFVALACASLYGTLQTVACLAFQNHLGKWLTESANRPWILAALRHTCTAPLTPTISCMHVAPTATGY